MKTLPTVHCLNLDRREDRLLSASKEAKKQGFPIMFFNGVDAKLEEIKPCIAITRGHKSIVQYAKDKAMEWVCVCEDDIFFYGDDNKAFQYFIDNIPPSFDVYMGCIYHGELKGNRVINGMSGSFTLIIIHSRFFDFILNEMPDDCYQDRYVGDFSYKYEYYVSPLIVCGQTPGFSDNRSVAHSGYDVYLLDKKVYGRD